MKPAHKARYQAAAWMSRVAIDIKRNMDQARDDDERALWQELFGDVEEAVELLSQPVPEPAEPAEEEE